MDIKGNVFDIIKSLVELDAELDNLEKKDFFEDLGFDSISIMELVSEVEKKFSIELSDEDILDAIVSVGDMIRIIEKNIHQ